MALARAKNYNAIVYYHWTNSTIFCWTYLRSTARFVICEKLFGYQALSINIFCENDSNVSTTLKVLGLASIKKLEYTGHLTQFAQCWLI